MGKDNDIAGLKRDRLSTGQLHVRLALDQEMVENHVCRPRCECGDELVGCGRGKPPGSGKFRAEENGAVQFDSAQNFGERIHSVLVVLPSNWTVCKVSRTPRKTIRFGRPLKQIIQTPG
jgi:hypothetical protein